MHHDTRKALTIRKANRDVLHADRTNTHIVRVPTAPLGRPLSYARFIPGVKAIVVVANGSHDANEIQTFTLAIPLAEMGLAGAGQYRVTNLWTGMVSVVEEPALCCYPVQVPSLYVDGGSRVLKIEPVRIAN